MDIKKAWENKTVRLSVIGALLVVIVYIISQSIFSTPVKKEKKTQKKDMQTNLLLDDSQMNKLSNEESQKVYKEMVKQNRLDQNAAKEDREKAEKAQQETKAQVASLTSQLQQLSQQINDMQTNRNGNRNLDAGSSRKTINEQAPAAPYQLNANAPINGVNPNYASITPTRNSPMRTITQSSIKTNGTDGVIQVTGLRGQKAQVNMGKSFVKNIADEKHQKRAGDSCTEIEEKTQRSIIDLALAGERFHFNMHVVYHPFPRIPRN